MTIDEILIEIDENITAMQSLEFVLDWSSIENKPTTFPPSTHTHDNLYALVNHNHSQYLTSLPAHNHDSLYATTTHNHNTLYSGINHTHDNLYPTYPVVNTIVDTKINQLISGAPDALNTLYELALEIQGQDTELINLLNLVGQKLDSAGFTWDALQGKPTEFVPITHSHSSLDYSNYRIFFGNRWGVGDDIIVETTALNEMVAPRLILHDYGVSAGGIKLKPDDNGIDIVRFDDNLTNIRALIGTFVNGAKLGDDSPAIKIKIINGTVPLNAGADVWVPCGITNLSQILTWECVIDCSGYLVDSHLYHSPTNHEFDVHIHTINSVPHVRVLTTTNSSAILGKSFRALIIYTN